MPHTTATHPAPVVDLGTTRLTLTPLTTQTIEVASFTTPDFTYRLDVVTGTRFVGGHCSCPAFTHRAQCKHLSALLDLISLQLWGVRAPGATSVPLPGDAPAMSVVDLFDVA